MQKFHLAHSRQWNRLVDTVMNFWVPWKLGNTWSSWVAISMLERLCSVELPCSDLVSGVSPQPSLSYRFYVYSLSFTKFKICNLSLLQHACNSDTVRQRLLWSSVLQSFNQCTSHDVAHDIYKDKGMEKNLETENEYHTWNKNWRRLTNTELDLRGVAIKKLDCFYYSFPVTSMTKRRVGHWPVDFPLPSHKGSFTRIG